MSECEELRRACEEFIEALDAVDFDGIGAAQDKIRAIVEKTK